MELPSLRHARAAAAAAVVGDKLVVVGGQNEKQLVAQTEVFDGESWTQAADLPTPREHLAAVSDGTYVYAVGGRFLSADKNSAAFERFDPASGDMGQAGGHADSARQLRRRVHRRPDRRRRWRGTDARAGHGRDVRHRRREMDGTRADAERRVTAEVVAAVGSTVYCIGGADRPTHEGAVRIGRGPGLFLTPATRARRVCAHFSDVPLSRSLPRVTAPRRMASLASRTRRSPSDGMANLS